VTTIVACAQDGAIFMGSDTLTNVYERPMRGAARKVIRMGVEGESDAALAGVAGDMGVLSLLQYQLQQLPAVPPASGYPSAAEQLNAWAYAVCRALSAAAVEAGIVEDGRMAASVLLGYRGRLWTLVHAALVHHDDGRAALGSGEGPAIGALDALLDKGFAPAEAVQEALQVAAWRDKHTAGPYAFEVLTGE
jgi:ATP-dependent protease HslVU (ClpYQ) peptidase subunit